MFFNAYDLYVILNIIIVNKQGKRQKYPVIYYHSQYCHHESNRY